LRVIPWSVDPFKTADSTEALSHMGDEGTAILLEFMEYEPVSEHAVRALGATGSPRAYPKLIELLGHQHGGIRESAATGLGTLKDARAVPALVALMDDASPRVVEAAAWALQRITAEDFGVRRRRPNLEADEYARHVLGVREKVRAWRAGE
jgi:HEAT repeat protein